jgi:phage-related protein
MDEARAEVDAAARDMEGSGGGDELGKDIGSDAGDEAGASFMSRFGSWLAPSKFQLISSAIAVALAGLPALGGIAGVGIGVALIAGLTGLLAAKDKALKAPFHSMLHGVMGSLEEAFKPMQPVLERIFAQTTGLFRELEPQFASVFRTIAPMMEGIFTQVSAILKGLVGVMQAAAPAFGPFIDGLLSLVKNILPPLAQGIKAVTPFLGEFGQTLGVIGKDVGSLFSSAGPVIRSSMVVLDALLRLIGGLLPVIMKIAGVLATSLAPVVSAVGEAFKALSPALVTVGRIFGELAGAVLKNLAGMLVTVAKFIGDLAPSFAVLAKVLGAVFKAMENAGVFAALEDSLENLAGPLAQLINALVTGIAPILPVLIQAFIDLTKVVVELMSTGLLTLIQALIPFAPTLAKIGEVILVVVVAMKAWAAVQALLNLAMDANPVGLIIAAIAALIVIIIEVVKHWHTVIDVVKDVVGHVADMLAGLWHSVERFGHYMVDATVGVVKTIIGWFIKLWDDAKSVFGRGTGDIIAFFRRLPGDILHALGDFGRMLWDAGKDIIMGLLHGLEDGAKWLWDGIKDIGHGIVHVFKDIMSIFSPSGVMRALGRELPRGVAAGIDDMAHLPGEAMARMSRNLTLRGAAGVAGGGGYTPLQFEVTGGSSEFEQLLALIIRRYVRVKGGGGPYSVQRAFGQSWPRVT